MARTPDTKKETNIRDTAEERRMALVETCCKLYHCLYTRYLQ